MIVLLNRLYSKPLIVELQIWKIDYTYLGIFFGEEYMIGTTTMFTTNMGNSLKYVYSVSETNAVGEYRFVTKVFKESMHF